MTPTGRAGLGDILSILQNMEQNVYARFNNMEGKVDRLSSSVQDSDRSFDVRVSIIEKQISDRKEAEQDIMNRIKDLPAQVIEAARTAAEEAAREAIRIHERNTLDSDIPQSQSGHRDEEELKEFGSWPWMRSKVDGILTKGLEWVAIAILAWLLYTKGV